MRLIAMAILAASAMRGTGQKQDTRLTEIARKHFGADAPWYVRNIPFLEIDDPEIEAVYYYRWQIYRSHIREIGAQGTAVLEFLPDVPWARKPWTDLNDSSSFHLMEGRWLRHPAVVNSLIDHLYAGGGNDRHFSEAVAAASEAAVEVTGDRAALQRNFDAMRQTYDLWDDHFDAKRNLYWIEPIADATEYTISSIDASGAGFEEHPDPNPSRNGFLQGFAYRASINTYQYGNALAIARVAESVGRSDIASEYKEKASRLQKATVSQLWNVDLTHFTDRYQRSTPYVKEGEFIRGRELVGYLPWLYEMTPKEPAESARYGIAWKHILSHDELLGDAGLRTAEPSYPRYMTQYRFEGARAECQWNGPSWPFQTSQLLTGLANLLDDYPAQSVIGPADYLRFLRQYTHQHYLSPEHLDLQEDYNPDAGGPIVGLDRSHHYEHSTYVDLILSGLIGIRPRSDEMLEISPLLPGANSTDRPIHYFALFGVMYHGHDVSIIYDESGRRYGRGKGLSVIVDGERASGPAPLQRILVPLKPLAASRLPSSQGMPEDLVVNLGTADGPQANASSATSPAAIKQAIDGRLWFFSEVANGWTPALDQAGNESWWSVTIPQKRRVGSIEIYFLDTGTFHAPKSYQIQYETDSRWIDVLNPTSFPRTVIGNGRNQINFPPVETDGLRLLLPGSAAGTQLRLIEFEAFQQPRP
ncbi:MAG: discoidin domain-containing protein [Acidobacteriota bacterium]|nr:discoidin domain-containing protein [Acidobacteriota bacterium]